MEETGCEQGEAELALELAGEDLEKAIHTIESLLRHIFALKAKFYLPEKNFYGLLMAVINTKTKSILRLSTVISYNPALYENSPEMDWYTLEKLIFSYRLDGGSIPDFTQDIENRIQQSLAPLKELLAKADKEAFGSFVTGFFAPEKVVAVIETEELNLAQFRRLPDGQETPSVKANAVGSDPGAVVLQVGLIEDKNGRPAGRLTEQDVVLTTITDSRDIAHYLAHLIGHKKDDKSTPLPAVIKKVTAHKGESEILVFYAPGISGITRVENDFKVKVGEENNQPWWKKIINWN